MRIFKKGAEKEITEDPLALFRQDKLKWAQGSCYSTKRRPGFKSSFSNLFTLSSKSYLCKTASGNWPNQKSLPGWHSSFPHHKQEGPRKETGCLPVPPAPPPESQDRKARPQGPSCHGSSPGAFLHEDRKTGSSRAPVTEGNTCLVSTAGSRLNLSPTPSSPCNDLFQGAGPDSPVTNINICSICESCTADRALSCPLFLSFYV